MFKCQQLLAFKHLWAVKISCLAKSSMIVLLPRFQLYSVCRRYCFLPRLMFWEGCEVHDPFGEWDTD